MIDVHALINKTETIHSAVKTHVGTVLNQLQAHKIKSTMLIRHMGKAEKEMRKVSLDSSWLLQSVISLSFGDLVCECRIRWNGGPNSSFPRRLAPKICICMHD